MATIKNKPVGLIEFNFKNTTPIRVKADSLDIKDNCFFGFTENGKRFVAPVGPVTFSMGSYFDEPIPPPAAFLRGA